MFNERRFWIALAAGLAFGLMMAIPAAWRPWDPRPVAYDPPTGLALYPAADEPTPPAQRVEQVACMVMMLCCAGLFVVLASRADKYKRSRAQCPPNC